MAKANSPRKPQREPFRLDIFLIEIAGKFGISGACILTVLYIFLKSATLEQHREFIDKFILLKTKTGDNGYILYLAIIAVIAFVGQTLYFRNRLKLKDDRIKQIEEYNNSIENKLLKNK